MVPVVGVNVTAPTDVESTLKLKKLLVVVQLAATRLTAIADALLYEIVLPHSVAAAGVDDVPVWDSDATVPWTVTAVVPPPETAQDVATEVTVPEPPPTPPVGTMGFPPLL
jgi:hypothetical protein